MQRKRHTHMDMHEFVERKRYAMQCQMYGSQDSDYFLQKNTL